jgi:hypothetical protein
MSILAAILIFLGYSPSEPADQRPGGGVVANGGGIPTDPPPQQN